MVDFLLLHIVQYSLQEGKNISTVPSPAVHGSVQTQASRGRSEGFAVPSIGPAPASMHSQLSVTWLGLWHLFPASGWSWT